MKPLYIFDLDGTVALIDHRRDILSDKDDSHRWRKFYAACDLDLPNAPVIEVMRQLWYFGAEIWVFSGRSAEVRDKTVAWLSRHTTYVLWDNEAALVMRDEGDNTPDDELKKRWLDSMLPQDRMRLVATFDDRDRVVKMWRDNGITCFQVADGDF